MPAHPPLLIGRAGPVRRYRALRADGVVVISVVGPRGVGTSRLAATLASAAERVWWADVDGGASGAALARCLGVGIGGLSGVLGALPPGLIVLDGVHAVSAADRASIARWVAAGPHLEWLIAGAVASGLADERTIPIEPLVPADALRLFETVAGEVEPETPALVRRLGGLPSTLVWAARRAPILSAADQMRRLDARLERGAPPHRAHLAAEWPQLAPDLRASWLVCALTAGVTPLSLVERAGGTVEAIRALRARGLVETRKYRVGTRVVVSDLLAEAAGSVAGTGALRDTAARVGAQILPRLRAWRQAYGGPTGPQAAAQLAEWAPAIRRLAGHGPPQSAAEMLNCLQPLRLAAECTGRPDPVLEAAVDAARRSGDAAEIVDARVGQARHAFTHGAFSRALSILAAPELHAAEHWRLEMVRAHCALRTGRADIAAGHLTRAAAWAPDADARLQVDVQRALGLALGGEEARAIEALAGIAHEADAVGASRTAAVARWHLGCAQVDRRAPLAGVAALRRAAEVLGGLGEHACTVISRGWIARGLRRAGELHEAEVEAHAGHRAARDFGLPEAELDCARELLWLALERHDPAAIHRWRLALMAVLPETRRPRAVERARLALTAAAAVAARLLVAADGTWLRTPAGETVDLQRRRAARRMLACLCAAHRRTPGRALDVQTLFDAGWPDTEIRPESRARRVYTAIWQLRDLGLGDGLVHDGGGYRLAEGVVVAPDRLPSSRPPPGAPRAESTRAGPGDR